MTTVTPRWNRRVAAWLAVVVATSAAIAAIAAATVAPSPTGAVAVSTRSAPSTTGSEADVTENDGPDAQDSQRPGPGAAGPAPAGPREYIGEGTWMSSASGLTPLRGEARVVVDEASGDHQLVRRTHGPARADTELVFRPDGVHVARLVFDNDAFSADFTLPSPGMVLPAAASAGSRWGWEATSSDGETTLVYEASFMRRELLDVGAGRRASSLVVSATLSFTGEVESTIAQVLWLSPDGQELLQLRESGRGRVGRSVFQLDTMIRLAPSQDDEEARP